MSVQEFDVTVADGGRGRALIPVPFDPDAEWGTKSRHPVGGSINGRRVRGVVELHDGVQGFVVGVAWLRECPLVAGEKAHVELAPEGPQRDDLAEDVASALQANPYAGMFFDSLAQFYRRGYLRWIDGTKRRPELRQQRIATMVELLEAGVKDHRNPSAGRPSSSATYQHCVARPGPEREVSETSARDARFAVRD